MQYLVADRSAIGGVPLTPEQIVAQGEMIVFEGPWPWGAPIIARIDDAALAGMRAAAVGPGAYAVEALSDPGTGEAFVIAAHRMRDAQGFRPYADAVADIVHRFGGRFLTRGGTVTAIAGDFVPDRAVIIAFPTAAEAVAFYLSDVYAPLLAIRHATTDPRFVLLARTGALPAGTRAAAENGLRSRRDPSH
jgi:uncharacterized protein (DUF1330 family)